MKKHEEGSALIWAVAVVMVLFVSVAAALSISSAYYQRTMNVNDKRQAYLSAKGVIEDIVENIIINNEAYLALFKDVNESEKTYLSIPIDPSLGVIPEQSSYIEVLPKEETRGKITISVTVNVNEADCTILADMNKGKIDTIEKWQLFRYYQGEQNVSKPNNITKAAKILADMKNLGTCWSSETDEKVTNACLLAKIKVDDEEYQNIMSSNPNYWPRKDNDMLRIYFYYREKPYGWLVYDKSEITNLELKDKLKKDEYYMQTLFLAPDYKSNIVYAKAQNNNDLASGWSGVQLFYNEGHWYYVNNVNYADFDNANTETSNDGVMVLRFESDLKAPNNSSIEKWARFVNKYLIPENRLE